MIFTNNLHLPEPDYHALMADDYVPRGDISVTGLKKSPREFWLVKRHFDEIVRDVQDNMRLMLGSAGHAYIDAKTKGMPGILSEHPMLVKLQSGIELSGTFDMMDVVARKLWDRKFTSVWTLILGGREEWGYQLNTYRLMRRMLGGMQAVPDYLAVIAYLVDWSRSKAKMQGGDYPQAPIMVHDIPLMDFDFIESWVNTRAETIMSHIDTSDDDLPLCSDEERWMRGEKWAVHKVSGGSPAKRAMTGGLHDTLTGAQAFAEQAGCETQIMHRPGQCIKCSSYCDASAFCSQWKADPNHTEEANGE